MAPSSYPHMIFAADPEALSKTSLSGHLTEWYGDRAGVEDAPLKVVATIDGYAVTFWFDDDADGLAERYADYLPETARRRRFTACTTMIDASGAPDEEHAGLVHDLMTRIAGLDKVWVFSEERKQFVGLDYGEGAPESMVMPEPEPAPVLVSEPPVVVPEPEPAPVVVPEPEPIPVLVPEPEPLVTDASETPEPLVVPEPESEPEPELEPELVHAAPTHEPVGTEPTGTEIDGTESLPAESVGTETVPTPLPEQRTEPTDSDRPEEEKQGFFRRVFGRRNR